MAVTQQIVRLPERIMNEASADPVMLDRLVSFELAGPEDTLDLDWAPRGLQRLAEQSLSEVQCAALSALLDGPTVLNRDYPEGPDHYRVWSDITFLSAPEVKRAANILASVTSADLLLALPSGRKEQADVLGSTELPTNPAGYYGDHLTALLDFAQEAARRGFGLVQWWD